VDPGPVITLVIGGIRSGKSTLGARLAGRLGDAVTVVIPGTFPDDPDLAARVRAHQAGRPASWTTLECGDALPATLAATAGPALVDSLGTWVAQVPGFAADPAALIDATTTRAGPTVLVTEEVGLSVHPPTESGRRFADALGALNHAVAAVADEVLLAVAGRALTLPADPGGRC
jgi:adenosyl cobinamide kinase/adenosyl cobinamide phosphate guanylyltransferase